MARPAGAGQPNSRSSDAQIAVFLEDMIIQERAFRDYPLRVLAGSAKSQPVVGAAAVGGGITLPVSDAVVTLQGTVSTGEQRRMALQDAWFILGVHGVDNRLQVR